MKFKKFSIAATLMLILLISACGSAPPKPGAWMVPWEYDSTENGIGPIFFSVNSDSTVIDSFDLLPINWKCGNTIIQGDKFLVGASEEDPYTVNENSPALVQGNLANIEDGSFSFQLDVFHFENSIFEMKAGVLTFEGTFTSANEASGTWELVLGGVGDSCTGTWNAIPNEARNE